MLRPPPARGDAYTGTWPTVRGIETGSRPEASTRPVSTSTMPLPPSSPGSQACTSADARAAISGTAWTRPLTSTTTVGVPVARTASTSCCCTPVSASDVASRASPTVECGCSPDSPPTNTTATAAPLAASTAAASPLVSSPVMPHPRSWTTRSPNAARSASSGVTWSVKYGPAWND